MFHELTSKMRQRDIKSDRWDDVDSIIRTYLEEKVNILNEPFPQYELDWSKWSRKVFGLSSSKEVGEWNEGMTPSGPISVPKPKDSENHTDGPNCVPCQKRGEKLINSWEPKDSEVWCEEIKLMPYGYYFKGSSLGCHVPDDWKQCPVCMVPRPKPKTLAEKFGEERCYLLPDAENPDRNKTGKLTSSTIRRLADIAEQYYKESKGC